MKNETSLHVLNCVTFRNPHLFAFCVCTTRKKFNKEKNYKDTCMMKQIKAKRCREVWRWSRHTNRYAKILLTVGTFCFVLFVSFQVSVALSNVTNLKQWNKTFKTLKWSWPTDFSWSRKWNWWSEFKKINANIGNVGQCEKALIRVK